MDGAASTDLTGVWLGLYSYPRLLDPVSFTAILMDTAGMISGTTHELSSRAPFFVTILTAALCGRCRENSVEFIKTYDDGIPHSRAITYEGDVGDNGSEIEGRWIIPRTWSGRFLMIRSVPDAEAIVRKKYEGVSI